VELDDTIVAISTPQGRGGIGVVRLAGPEAKAIAAPLFRLRHELEPGRAIFGELIEPSTGERIDEVVVTFFHKPYSYTTDDIVEISAHGAPVVLRYVVELAVTAGARLAEPGEFTLRAFLNGRLDLTQAEAVRDLIESQTLYQAKVAAQQLGGALAHRLQSIKQRLVELIAVLEAGIDFAEDDVPVATEETIQQRLEEIQGPLAALDASFTYGKVVHEGMTLAIVGRPNVGKSSLFNRLVERERAIVTATPGTTRDLVSETVSLGGIPVRLVDTAGIRAASDEAESIGIEKAYEALADADLVLVVIDLSQPAAEEDARLVEMVGERPKILVQNKADLTSPQGVANREQEAGGSGQEKNGIVRTSALTGEGLERLREEILQHVAGDAARQCESGFLTNVRHQELVRGAIAGLDAGRRALEQNIPHEMMLLDLYTALHALDGITGATTTDDILNLIFSSFCIGK